MDTRFREHGKESFTTSYHATDLLLKLRYLIQLTMDYAAMILPMNVKGDWLASPLLVKLPPLQLEGPNVTCHLLYIVFLIKSISYRIIIQFGSWLGESRSGVDLMGLIT